MVLVHGMPESMNVKRHRDNEQGKPIIEELLMTESEASIHYPMA